VRRETRIVVVVIQASVIYKSIYKFIYTSVARSAGFVKLMF
jgi:hypothetical protein